MQRGERFPEAVQLPLLASRVVLAGESLLVYALAAIQASIEHDVLQDAKEVSLGPSHTVGENQPSVRIEPPPLLHQFNEVVRQWDAALLFILWREAEVFLLAHGEGLVDKINIRPAGIH